MARTKKVATTKEVVCFEVPKNKGESIKEVTYLGRNKHMIVTNHRVVVVVID